MPLIIAALCGVLVYLILSVNRLIADRDFYRKAAYESGLYTEQLQRELVVEKARRGE